MSSEFSGFGFHDSVAEWLGGNFKAPTPVQEQAWRAIGNGNNTLVAAPTGSGKTLAAFLCAIDELVTLSRGAPLEDRVYVLYVSPLKALSNDIERNLQAPLTGIEQWLADHHEPASGIRAVVRTGDTSAAERNRMRRKPPQILVTTPESLYLLLTSTSGRDMLSRVGTVIVDEIHALAGNKRGSHLSLSLARLDALCGAAPMRIGLSATQKPLDRIAGFLCGERECSIVDTGHRREWDLELELTQSPLAALMANETWVEIYDRLAELIEAHETTLIFVNTRRLAERLTRHLAERIGESIITAHHGSLSKDHRHEAEQALKGGQLKALVATASLELGIDIGHVDLVCQLGSPGSISSFLQRVGRSGHKVGETPRGRLFPLSRDDLVECVALLQSTRRGELDRIRIPPGPLDVLSQQLVAECSARDWHTDQLFEVCRSAWPYRDLERSRFDQVIAMLSEGYATRRGRRSAWLFHDAINGLVKARPAARLTALQNGGAIPDHFDYDVVMLPQGHRIGTLNEDFAFESIPGDIFQLGNTSYQILKIEQGRVLVEDAQGQPPTIPFWFGDRPGRSDELSAAVSRLREQAEQVIRDEGREALSQALASEGLQESAALQLAEYLDASLQALGRLPTFGCFVLERFFDDTGDMHLVVHAPLGSRLMRAWGLALRKRFCRQFNFELQASALEDSLILSLGETHSFDLSDVPSYLNPCTVRDVLTQALLDAPMFEVRWRWNATIALAVQRMRNGQKLPPQWQRNQSEDLIAVVFPDQLACLENIRGAREIPDHPLVRQTIDDCLNETMDIEGLERLLESLSAGDIDIHCADLSGPSPMSREIINARPYAFLDDGEAENRRTRAIRAEPDDLSNAATLRIISTTAIEQVQAEAWIRPRNPDELHDGLLQAGFLTAGEFGSGNSSSGAHGSAAQWPAWFNALAEEGRACHVSVPGHAGWWVATERLPEWRALYANASARPDQSHFVTHIPVPERQTALDGLLRDRLNMLGPVTAGILAADFGLDRSEISAALTRLQAQGFVIAMPGDEGDQRSWCERRLLARIHRYSRERRRQAVKPVSPAEYLRFLSHWHGLGDGGGDSARSLAQLEGWTAPLMSWERAILGARNKEFSVTDFDQRFLSGELCWFRPPSTDAAERQVVSASPIAIVPRDRLSLWYLENINSDITNSYAIKIMSFLEKNGASFTRDIELATGLLRPHLEEGLRALVYAGRVTADAFSPLRWVLRPEKQKARIEKRRGAAAALPVGRWSLMPAADTGTARPHAQRQQELAEISKALLRRYGVVFRAVIERESLLPPWRDILRALRRLEDRGEVRGGRFVDGFSGEQFALPEAAGLLRKGNPLEADSRGHVISASDPLNLGGWLTPGVRTPAGLNNRILLHEGLPVARIMGDQFEELPGIPEKLKAGARERLTTVSQWRARKAR